jgi:hypothetical protein
MTIDEGNRLIAEFMGEDTTEDAYVLFGPDAYDIEWRYLMPVVEKIESIKDDYQGHFGVYISSNNCTIQSTKFRPDKRIPDPTHYFCDWTLENKLTSTWTAVVYFIKWYNQNK